MTSLFLSPHLELADRTGGLIFGNFFFFFLLRVVRRVFCDFAVTTLAPLRATRFLAVFKTTFARTRMHERFQLHHSQTVALT